MTGRATLSAYMHIEGFENFHRESFDKKKVRKAFRKVGQLVQQRAQLNISLSGGQSDYPKKITGVLRDSIRFKVSRSGFMVKIMPEKITGMEEYYPAFLHYGVKKTARSNGKKQGRKISQPGNWRIEPRANYVAHALEDESARVRAVLTAGFAAALG